MTVKTDDAVLTPTGSRAQVKAIDHEGFCLLIYLSGPEQGKETTVHERLLRRISRGREAPPPVRVDANGRRT